MFGFGKKRTEREEAVYSAVKEHERKKIETERNAAGIAKVRAQAKADALRDATPRSERLAASLRGGLRDLRPRLHAVGEKIRAQGAGQNPTNPQNSPLLGGVLGAEIEKARLGAVKPPR